MHVRVFVSGPVLHKPCAATWLPTLVSVPVLSSDGPIYGGQIVPSTCGLRSPQVGPSYVASPAHERRQFVSLWCGQCPSSFLVHSYPSLADEFTNLYVLYVVL